MRIVCQSETSNEGVERFLKEIGDDNPAHLEHRILPGIFAIKLLERELKDRNLKNLEITFDSAVLFPTVLELETKEIPYGIRGKLQDRLKFRFHVGKKTIYHGKLEFVDEEPTISNEEKLNMVYRIGGELQRQFRDRKIIQEGMTGLYNSQTMVFNGGNALIGPLFGEYSKEGKRVYNIRTYGTGTDEKTETAKGNTAITIVPEKTIAFRIKKLRAVQ